VNELSEPLRVALRVARELERLGVPYVIGGSVATLLHGEPRATLDVDFAVHLTPDRAAALAAALEDDFFAQPEALIEAARAFGMCNVIHKHPMLKVDLHVRAARGHSAEEMRRAVRMQLGSDPRDVVRVATVEDSILAKLRWYRSGGEVSDRQWSDVLGVAKLHIVSLDRGYLERWASELGLTDLLARVLDRARDG
jgi:hypothetical protein